MLRTQLNYLKPDRVKLCARHITPVKKKFAKTFTTIDIALFYLRQQFTIGLCTKNLLKCMNNNLLFAIHKNLHECLLAIKI